MRNLDRIAKFNNYANIFLLLLAGSWGENEGQVVSFDLFFTPHWSLLHDPAYELCKYCKYRTMEWQEEEAFAAWLPLNFSFRSVD